MIPAFDQQIKGCISLRRFKIRGSQPGRGGLIPHQSDGPDAAGKQKTVELSVAFETRWFPV